jgi:glycopeptide antibiotics resistance protein
MDQSIGRSRPRWVIATVLFSGVVLMMTLWPDSTVNTSNYVPFREHGAAWSCLIRGCAGAGASAQFLIKDVIGNVVVFMPIGFAGAGAINGSLARKFWLATGLGALLSLFIETTQILIETRATDVDDLIFNTVGTVLGATLLVATRGRR